MLRCLVILAAMTLSVAANAHDNKYALGLKGVGAVLSGGDSAKFTFQKGYGAVFSYRFYDRWLFDFDLSTYKLYNDTTAGSSFAFGGGDADATRLWRATRIGVQASRYLFSPKNPVNMTVGVGGGLMIWKFVDPHSDTTLKVRGALNETVDFSASEIFVTAAGGIELALLRSLSLKWDLRTDYLTAVGAEFQADVNSSRPRWLMGSSVSISFSFGQVDFGKRWKSEKAWATTTREVKKPVDETRDSDGDGVPDHSDRCLATWRGAIVDSLGCPVDSDGDGVSDGRDDCPHTDRQACGKVDIFGCPVDSDFDGLPDYLDACPFNKIGAKVDASGCPVDSDADGVPDGLDDCPNTLYGVDVDRYGCIDLYMFSKPIVLNIDYVSGSFEVDPISHKKIKELARILNFVPDIKLEINGYTDNIGKPRANKSLSEKRARRVRDFLVVLDVAADRIKVFGRGESNFVASNETAEGRAKNRRVEISFYR